MPRKITAVLITREDAWPKDVPLNFDFDELLVETRCPNVRRRFELAQQAKHEHIYVQDDDNVIDIKALYEHYDDEHLTNVMIPGIHETYEPTGVTLLGYGAFFPKSLINFSRWERTHGEVDAMEADRIFTFLAQPHRVVFQDVKQIRRAEKMCERQGHYETRQRFFDALAVLP